MVQVPSYAPIPSTQPTEQGAPRIGVSTPLAAFGGAEAQATEKLGAGLSQAGNELFNRAIALQQLDNQAQARNITLDAANKLGQARAEYLTTQGIDAKNALPKYQAQIANIRQEALGSAKNPIMRQLVDSDITNRMTRDLDYAGSHAATEFKKYTVDSSKGLVDLAVQGAGVNPEDEGAWQSHIQSITEHQNSISTSLGLPKAQADFNLHTAIASAATKRAESLALTKPELAMKFYLRDPSIFGAQQVQVQKFIQNQLTTVRSKTIADHIVNGAGDYFTRLQLQESGAAGTTTTKAPTSSATGLYQFTDKTWADTRAAHPELNLPTSAAGATTDQQTAAVKALTVDNAAALKAKGIEPTQPNLYMAHFLGASGAAKFIAGMKADPTQPGTALATPAQVEANRSIFQNLDGSPRSAAEVYMRLTANFMGPGPLTRDSGGDWLANAQKAGTAIADQFSEFDPNLKAAVLSRIETNYNQIHKAAQQADQGNYLSVAEMVGGPGQPGALTDMSQLSPIAQDMVAHLPLVYQNRIANQLKANAKFSPNDTPQRDQNYQKIMNMSLEANGKVPEFMKVDPYAEVNAGNITRKQADSIYAAQRSTARGQAADSRHLQHVLSITSDYLKGLHLDAGSDQELQYKAELNTWLKDYEKQKSHFPSDDESRQQAAAMVASQGGWHGLFAHPAYEVPKEFSDKITPDFMRRSGGKAPTAEELGKLYQRSLDYPELFAKYK